MRSTDAPVRLGATSLSPQAMRKVQLLTRPLSFDLAVPTLLAVTALCVSLLHPWSHAYVGEVQFGDAAYWDFNGENWARGYIAAKSPDIRPGYSVFLGVVYALFGSDFKNGFIAQTVLYAVGVFLLYVLGKRLAGRLVGVAAAVFFALDPYMWEWTATSTTDLLGSIINLGALFCLATAFTRGGSRERMARFGVLFGFANVVRVFSLAFVGPALLVPLLLRRTSWGRRLALVGVGLATTLLGLLPGVLYQYAATGDPGLSSNTASAMFGASSPKYRAWTPQMYDDIGADMRARGEFVTAQTLDAEFRRLTILNYLQYPAFQVQRVVYGMIPYVTFEGELERPERYVFYRPVIMMATAAIGVGLILLNGGLRKPWLLLPSIVLLVGLFEAPIQTLIGVQTYAVAYAVWEGVRRRSGRALGMLEIATYWASAGFFAVVTAGVSGFLLNRLYTQVEPARALLLAFGAVHFIFLLTRQSRPAGAQNLRHLVMALPRLPAYVQQAMTCLVLAAVLIVGMGGARLVAANVGQTPGQPFQVPSIAELETMSDQLGLSLPINYVDDAAFAKVRAELISGSIPLKPEAYALPGQFTRFLWYVDDEQRTLYWYVYSDQERPATLDRNLLLVESLGELPQASFRDRSGLLLVAQNSAYDDSAGQPTLMNLLTTRAFIPWDSATNGFRLDQAVRFPLDTPLYDHKRFATAHISGNVVEAGPQAVKTGDRTVRAYSLEAPQKGGSADLRFSNLWILGKAEFRAWVSLHPQFFGNRSASVQTLEVRVRDGAREDTIARIQIDPMRPEQQVYVPLIADLSPYANKSVDLTIGVISAESGQSTAEVLVGEPRVVSP
jgi:4-amino-4-deoxy-L-arabinose transferase-like glycosyltransferase